MFEFASGAEGVWDANRFNEPATKEARFTFGEALMEGNAGAIRLYGDGRLMLQRLGGSPRRVDYVCPNRGFAGDCVRAEGQAGRQPARVVNDWLAPARRDLIEA